MSKESIVFVVAFLAGMSIGVSAIKIQTDRLIDELELNGPCPTCVHEAYKAALKAGGGGD